MLQRFRIAGTSSFPTLTSLVLGVAAVAVTATQARAGKSIELADADPATIQAALDDTGKCPTSGEDVGCHLVLPCDKHVVTDGADLPILIDGLTNIRISGCGMNGTTINWDPSTVTATGYFNKQDMLLVTGGSRWITIEDVKLEVICSQECTALIAAAKVEGDSEDVTFERVHFHAASPGTASSDDPKGLALAGGRKVFAYGSRFHASGYGLNVYDCEDCWFSGNWFGPITSIGGNPARPGYGLASKRKGTGVRFTNNTFDLGYDIPVGLYLRSGGPSTETETTVHVIGNSFVNMQDRSELTVNPPQRGIYFYRYNRANVQNNLFACDSDEDACEAIGIATLGFQNKCEPDTVPSCNQQNLIANNVFDRIVDNDSAWCPVHFEMDTVLNRDNIVRDNLFGLGTGSATGANGCCGPNEGNNTCSPNDVFAP